MDPVNSPGSCFAISEQLADGAETPQDIDFSRGEEDQYPSRPSSRLGFNRPILLGCSPESPSDSEVIQWSRSLFQSVGISDLRISSLKTQAATMKDALPPESYTKAECSSVNQGHIETQPMTCSDGYAPSPVRKPPPVSRLCFPFVTTSSPRRSKPPPPPRHKYSCSPSLMSPIASGRPYPKHQRHSYRQHGYSRTALQHVKWFWSMREDEWENCNNQMNNAKAYEGIAQGNSNNLPCRLAMSVGEALEGISQDESNIPSQDNSTIFFPPRRVASMSKLCKDISQDKSSISSQSKSHIPLPPRHIATLPPVHLAPAPAIIPPMTVHPRRGDIAALRDPYCMHIDRCFVGLPTWTINKTLWMHDLHMAIELRTNAFQDMSEEDSESESELETSGSTNFSDDSDTTLVESESESDLPHPRQAGTLDKHSNNKTKTEEPREIFSGHSSSLVVANHHSPKRSREQLDMHEASWSPPLAAATKPRHLDHNGWATNWYRRWELLIDLSHQDRERAHALVEISPPALEISPPPGHGFLSQRPSDKDEWDAQLENIET